MKLDRSPALLGAAFLGAALALGPAVTSAQTVVEISSPPVTLSDGSVARVYDHCGEGDLCASIDYPNGDRLSFFSEGAALDQPYVVHFVRTNAKGTVYQYSRAVDRLKNHSQLTLDHGKIHLDIDYVHDGTLSFSFSKIAQR